MSRLASGCPVLVSGCGAEDSSNYSGLANLNFAPNGISLVLQLTGFFVAGTGRATTGGAPKGVYGVQLIGEPFPNANVEVLNFDASGGITASLLGPGGTTAFTGGRPLRQLGEPKVQGDSCSWLADILAHYRHVYPGPACSLHSCAGRLLTTGWVLSFGSPNDLDTPLVG
jgi:hypothetical protein